MPLVKRRKSAIAAIKWLSAISDLAMGRRRGPRILIYHQVGARSGLEMDLEPEAFEMQLDWMTERGEIVDLDTALARWDTPGSDRLYVLTFDDGHLSLFENAFPLMVHRRVPFTLYVTTAPLESDGRLHGDERMALMSWDHLRAMQRSGLMTVGAHGHLHLDARIHPQSVLAEDIQRCNDLLMKRLGVEPRHFAYPWGHRSDAAEVLVKQHYHSAAIGSQAYPGGRIDIHRISRIPVMYSDGSAALFIRKMWGGFRLEAMLRSLKDRLAP